MAEKTKMTRYTPEFEEFWRAYPGRYHEAGRPRARGGYEHYWKENKRKASEWWGRLSEYDKKWAMYSVKFMRRGKYVPDAFRWLRDGKYEDIDLPEEKGQKLPKEMTNVIKLVPGPVDVNAARNINIKSLGVKP